MTDNLLLVRKRECMTSLRGTSLRGGEEGREDGARARLVHEEGGDRAVLVHEEHGAHALLVRGEVQGTAELAQALAEHDEDDDEERRDGDDGGLDPKRDVEPGSLAPLELEVADAEARHRACEIDQGRDLARRRRQVVESVRRDGDRRDHDADDVQAPADNDEADVEVVLERLADDDEARDHDGDGDEVGRQARLGAEQAVMTAHVTSGDPVVGVVPEDLQG